MHVGVRGVDDVGNVDIISFFDVTVTIVVLEVVEFM